MNDSAYDISHLLALDARSLAAGPTATKSGYPAALARKAARQPTAAEVQDALSQELMRTAEFHEALIQQYLRSKDHPVRDIPGLDGP